MTTLAINSADRNLQLRKARVPHRAIVLAFGLAWYGALVTAAVLPAQSAQAAQATAQASQASVKESAQTNRVPGTCTPYRCR